jgi:hypothetical protein
MSLLLCVATIQNLQMHVSQHGNTALCCGAASCHSSKIRLIRTATDIHKNLHLHHHTHARAHTHTLHTKGCNNIQKHIRNEESKKKARRRNDTWTSTKLRPESRAVEGMTPLAAVPDLESTDSPFPVVADDRRLLKVKICPTDSTCSGVKPADASLACGGAGAAAAAAAPAAPDALLLLGPAAGAKFLFSACHMDPLMRAFSHEAASLLESAASARSSFVCHPQT